MFSERLLHYIFVVTNANYKNSKKEFQEKVSLLIISKSQFYVYLTSLLLLPYTSRKKFKPKNNTPKSG